MNQLIEISVKTKHAARVPCRLAKWYYLLIALQMHSNQIRGKVDSRRTWPNRELPVSLADAESKPWSSHTYSINKFFFQMILTFKCWIMEDFVDLLNTLNNVLYFHKNIWPLAGTASFSFDDATFLKPPRPSHHHFVTVPKSHSSPLLKWWHHLWTAPNYRALRRRQYVKEIWLAQFRCKFIKSAKFWFLD